jgi:hypothetical protein
VGRAFSVCLSAKEESTLSFSVSSSFIWTGLEGAPPGCTPKIAYTTSTRFRLIDLSRATQNYYYYGSFSAATLYCGEPTPSRTPSSDWDPSYYTWGMIPDADPNPLWPFPSILYFLVPVSPPNTTYLDKAPYDPRPNRFSYALLESYESFTDTSEVFSLSEKEWNKCKLQFGGGFITNIAGTVCFPSSPFQFLLFLLLLLSFFLFLSLSSFPSFFLPSLPSVFPSSVVLLLLWDRRIVHLRSNLFCLVFTAREC